MLKHIVRVMKERCRTAFHTTPFKRLPERLIIGLVACVLIHMNGLPWEHCVSWVLSLMTIATGRKLDHKLHCTMTFGHFAHARRDAELAHQDNWGNGNGNHPQHAMRSQFSEPWIREKATSRWTRLWTVTNVR